MGHVRITLGMLKKLDACAPHRDIFRATFPRGVTLTPEVSDAIIDKVVESKLDVYWLAREVLTKPAYAKYLGSDADAYSEYRSAGNAAEAEYQRVTATAWVEYERVTDAVDGERVRDEAWDECRRAYDAASAKYERACVRAAWVSLADRGNWKPGILA